MNPTQQFKDEMVAGLRKMADWLESCHIDLPIPQTMAGSIYSGQITDPRGIVHSIDSVVGMALIAAMAGDVDKEVSSQLFKLKKDFGGGVGIEWIAYRENVCERVVVGTKVVPAQPAHYVEAVPEKVEEVVEWKCPSLLKAGASVQMPDTPELESPSQPLLNAPAMEEVFDDIPF